MLKPWSVLAVSALLLSMSSAQAATLSGIQGGVLVNSGAGYRAVVSTSELKVGDSVMVDAGGAAYVSFPDGCKVPVTTGSVVTIGAQSPCALEAQNGSQGAQGGGLNSTVLIGGAVVAAGVGGALALSGGGDSKAASP